MSRGSGSSTLKVAITGNEDFDFNTSMMIRDALPNIIRRNGKPDIEILKHARDSKDTYLDVRQVSKEIFEGSRRMFLPEPSSDEADDPANIDFVLHFGMETRGEQYAFETCAHRDGYEKPGADGTHVDSEHLKELGLPAILTTGFDVEAAFRKVRKAFPEPVTILSDHAGLYYCEFRLYSSLAKLQLEHPEKLGRALFMHLPQARSEKDIALGRDIAVAYITAVADDKLLSGT